MKKILFALILLLAIANIWVACSKDPTPTTPSSKEVPNTETTVSDRTGSVTISGGFGMELCGYTSGTGTCMLCSAAGYTGYPFEVDQDPTTVSLAGRCFHLQNKSGTAQTVTLQVPGCGTSYMFSIPAYSIVKFVISGCAISTCI